MTTARRKSSIKKDSVKNRIPGDVQFQRVRVYYHDGREYCQEYTEGRNSAGEVTEYFIP